MAAELAQPVRPPDPGVHGLDAGTRSSSRSRSKRRPSSHGVPRASVRLAARLGAGNRDPASEGHPTRRSAPRHVRGRPQALVAVGFTRQVESQETATSRIRSLRRHACLAPAPRNRPRHGRSERGLPGRPDRPRRRARHPELPRPAAVSPSRTSRGSTAGRSSAPGSGAPARAVLVRHPRRSAPPRLEAGRDRLARRVESRR